MSDDYLKLYEVMNDRIGELTKNYGILNEHHHKLELEVAKMATKIDTTVSIVKWVGGFVGLSFILQVLQMLKVI